MGSVSSADLRRLAQIFLGASGNGGGGFFCSYDKCDGGRGGEEEGEELVTGEAEEGFWGGAEEFVGEAEEAVADEVEVEVLAGEEFAVAEEEDEEECNKVEGDFDGDGGPFGGVSRGRRRCLGSSRG